jgi:hypothetical protein
MFRRLCGVAFLALTIPGVAVADPTSTAWHGRLEIVYTGSVPNSFQWDGSGYSYEIGGFIDNGWFDSNLAAGVGHYGLINNQWPDYWIYGLNLSVGYRSTSDYVASNPDLRPVLNNGTQYTSNLYAPGGVAQWTISFYNPLVGDLWQGDGPHPTLDGNIGSFPNVSPNSGNRQDHGNPFDPANDRPYMTVAWGTVGSPDTTYTRYDAHGIAEGQSGFESATAGFENGGYTVRHERMTLTDMYGGGVWDFGPTGTRQGTATPAGLGWGPTYDLVVDLYHDPLNISGLFGRLDPYGHPYVWTAVNSQGDPSTFWFEAPVPEPGTCVLAALGFALLVLWGRRKRRTT